MPISIAYESPELREALQRELRSGERLIWSGQPRPSAFARPMLPVAAFGLLFLGFAVFWTVAAAAAAWTAGNRSSAPAGFDWLALLFPLFGLPFLLIGAGLVLSPLAMRRSARRTIYAVTARRAIIMRGTLLGGREVRSFTIDDLHQMSRHERRDGSGDLVFQEQGALRSAGPGAKAPSVHTRAQGFYGVPAVAELERLVRDTLGLN
jgi:hypothetical protein